MSGQLRGCFSDVTRLVHGGRAPLGSVGPTSYADGMPAFWAVLALVVGTPLAVITLIPASLAVQRLLRPHTGALNRLYLTQESARACLGRVRSGADACTAALVVVSVAAAALAFGVPAEYADRRLVPMIAPVAATVGLLVLLAWPVAGPRPPKPVGVVFPAPVRWPVRAAGVALLLLLVVAVLAGAVSVPDSPSPRYRAFPRPAATSWSYDEAGLPVDIAYTARGVTPGWPGWDAVGPLLAGLLVMAIMAALALMRVRAWGSVPAQGSAADAAARTVVCAVVAWLVLLGCLGSAAWLLATAGEVLVAVSVIPRPVWPATSEVTSVGHAMPLYLVGQVARYAWLVLLPALLVTLWCAVLAARELRSGAAAARAVLASVDGERRAPVSTVLAGGTDYGRGNR